MLKFFKKIAIATLLCSILPLLYLAIVFPRLTPRYDKLFQASVLDKVARVNEIDEAKIILVGNSNLVFGIQSPLIEEAFDMPVVNLGLHSGMGNIFHEEMAKQNIGEGDIVVLCHTDYSDAAMYSDSAILFCSIIENHKELFPLITGKNVLTFLRGLPNYIFSTIRSAPAVEEAVYARANFNECGDLDAPESAAMTYTFKEGDCQPHFLGDAYAAHLNKLNAYCEERGATLVIAGYPIGKGEFTAPDEAFIAFEEDLKSKLSIPVISHFTDYYFDYNEFADTELHLVPEAATKRTEQLIADLKQFLAE